MSVTEHAPLPDLKPEPSIWQKYSSRNEFPLSVLSSISIHLLIIMGIIALLAIGFIFPQFGKTVTEMDKGNMQLDVIPGGSTMGDAGEDANTEKAKFQFDLNKIEAEPNLFDLDPTSLDPANRKPTPTNEGTSEAERLKKFNDAKNTGGEDGGGGNRKGPGDGIGQHQMRTNRWIINIRYDEPEVFLRKLQELNVVIIAQKKEDSYLVFDDLKNITGVRTETLQGINQKANQMKRAFYVDRNRASCYAFGEAAKLDFLPQMLLLFIPQELEQQMLKAELAHANLSERDVMAQGLKTKFEITRPGTEFVIKVISQGK